MKKLYSQWIGAVALSHILAFAADANDKETISFDSVKNQLASGVQTITQAGNWRSAYAALLDDGRVVTWGDTEKGGISSSVSDQLTNVLSIASNSKAFAAIKNDGSVVTWGSDAYGGNSTVTSTTWEQNEAGISVQKVTNLKNVAGDLQSGVVKIVPNKYAFAALKSDGSVVTWGRDWLGGNSESWWRWDGSDKQSVLKNLQEGVAEIFSNYQSFAALKQDGSVVVWGHPWGGATSYDVSQKLQSDVKTICSTRHAFAALKNDGSVVTWGGIHAGGEPVISKYNTAQGYTYTSIAESLNSGVVSLFSTMDAFAALKSDGSVVTWGSANSGGDSSDVAAGLTSGVVEIIASWNSFAALKTDGSVTAWGGRWYGVNDFTGVENQLKSGVVKVVATSSGFSALKDNGSVIAWGLKPSQTNQLQLATGVNDLVSDEVGFTAFKGTNSALAWSSRFSEEFSGLIQKVFFTADAIGAEGADGKILWIGFTGSSDYSNGSGSISSTAAAGSGGVGSGMVEKSKKGKKGASKSSEVKKSTSKKSDKNSGEKKSGGKKNGIGKKKSKN
jgi:alpha-tubulin suppressor-like RCC1 family protein